MRSQYIFGHKSTPYSVTTSKFSVITVCAKPTITYAKHVTNTMDHGLLC